MYNIALCFYGEPRNVGESVATLSKFNRLSREMFNIDVYLHLWDNTTRRFDTLDPTYEKHFLNLIKENKNLDQKFVIESNLQHEELLKSLNPVNYKIENKSVLDQYIDKFNPNNRFMSCEEIKRAVKYSNTPPFSQLYTMSQCFNIIEDKEKYDLVIIIKIDYGIYDESITNKILKQYCKKIERHKNYLFVEGLCLRCSKKEIWIHHGYMMASPTQFEKLFNDFPKIPIGMGIWTDKQPHYKWKGHNHAEFGNYIMNCSDINRVEPIGSQFTGKLKQFPKEILFK